jgi:hypothetical protein
MKASQIILLIIGALFYRCSSAATLPQNSTEKHMGVATCSSGVCHGKSVEDSSENVMMTEYRTWLQQDDHAGAYKTLLRPTSRMIAKKLGLKSAHTAKICLDCHADNVAINKRGKKFQISDGVACEACHGGAENWLSDHKEPGATHEKNIKLGLYPSEKPKDRSQLCLSCHLGTANKFATHRIMGAGHPRLSFELESFSQNQPAHYKVDADYETRKGSIRSVNMWITGLIFKANAQLQLLQSKRFRQHGLFPELSFYECHSCHRAMSPTRSPIESGSKHVPAGSVRLDDASAVVLASVLRVLASDSVTQYVTAIKKLHSASNKGREATIVAAKELQKLLEQLTKGLVAKTYGSVEKRLLRSRLLKDASRGFYRDYSSAEQVFFAVETLSIDLNDENRYKAVLDKLFNAINEEDKYQPDQFSTIAKLFLKAL